MDFFNLLKIQGRRGRYGQINFPTSFFFFIWSSRGVVEGWLCAQVDSQLFRVPRTLSEQFLWYRRTLSASLSLWIWTFEFFEVFEKIVISIRGFVVWFRGCSRQSTIHLNGNPWKKSWIFLNAFDDIFAIVQSLRLQNLGNNLHKLCASRNLS